MGGYNGYYHDDLPQMNAQQREMVDSNFKLVYWLAKRFNFPKQDFEEVVSCFSFGLCKAAIKYDDTKLNKDGKPCKFSTFAVGVMKNEFFMYLRKKKVRENEVCLIDAIPFDTTEDYKANDEFTHILDNVVIDSNYRDIIAEVIETMPERQRQIVFIHLKCSLGGLPTVQSKIAKQVGVSQPQVSRTIFAFQSKVQELMNKKLAYN